MRYKPCKFHENRASDGMGYAFAGRFALMGVKFGMEEWTDLRSIRACQISPPAVQGRKTTKLPTK